MNTKAFAVAAVFGASAALASNCPEPQALPDNFSDRDWRQQAILKFQYMDSCPQDGRLSYHELQRYSGEVPDGLNQPSEPDSVFGAMLKMDSNANMAVEFSEYLRDAQTVAQPITDETDEVERFNYLSCKPQHDGGDYHNCRKSYDRADLRQTMYMLEDVEHVMERAYEPSHEARVTVYEVFINKEFRDRDYNNDGQVTQEEHDRHRLYKIAQGDIYDDIQDMDDGRISRAAYVALGDDHPWLHYLDVNEAFGLMDVNHDQVLSFEEAWSVAQMDDIIWRKFDSVYEKVDTDQDEMVTREEVLAYVASDFEGAMTSEQIREKAQDFFDKYNVSSAEHEGQQIIHKMEAYRVVAEADRAAEREEKTVRDMRYTTKQGWMTADKDHDDVILMKDLMEVAPQKTILDIYNLLGLNTVTDALRWEDVFERWIWKEYIGLRQLQIDWMATIHDYETNEPSYYFDLAEIIESEEDLAHYGETREELTRVFHLIDTDNDGLVNGEEACRHWVGDSDLLCHRFTPENEQWWLDMVQRWAANPIHL